MVPPPEPHWPEGVSVSGIAPGQDLRPVFQAVRDSFKDHWGHVERPFEEELDRWKQRIEEDPYYDPALFFLAMDGNEIAGVSLCRPKVDDDPEMGWVGTLGVRRPWRRRGLGLALLQHSFHELYRRDLRKVGLGVDAQSLTGATRLYEKAGMRSPVYTPELDIVAVAPDDRIAAFCIIWPDSLTRVGLFEPVGAHPDFQRKGLGRAVMNQGLRRLRACGMQTAIVCAVSDNPAAVRLYESAGFRTIQKIRALVKTV